jgi:hypothetical protein
MSGRGSPIGATELPPPPAVPSDPSVEPRRPSSVRLALFGVAGAVVASGLAVLLALQLAKPDIPAEAFAGPRDLSDAPATIAAVEGLRAQEGTWTADPESWRVSLSWQPVEGAARYLISRDGRRLEEAEDARFVDDTVTPEGRYRYEVVAVDADRNRSKAALVRVRTARLPKAAARVQGRWLLRLKVQSSNIFTGGGRILVTFTPDCRQGPCAVRWGFEDAGNTGTARNDGASYSGSGSGGFLTLDCHGGVVSSTVTLEFRVVTAHTVSKAWRATEIAGKVTESVPSLSNCLSARNIWTFTGSAQG